MSFMKISPTNSKKSFSINFFRLFVICLTLLVFQACSPENEENSNQSNTPTSEKKITGIDDELALGQVVNLPYVPEDVIWYKDEESGKVSAVILVFVEDIPLMIAEAEKHGKPKEVVFEGESWFPEEVAAFMKLSGDGTLKGLEYPANQFFKDSYNKGRLIKIADTNYFLLELFPN